MRQSIDSGAWDRLQYKKAKTLRRQEKIFAKFLSDQGLVSKIHKEFSKFNNKKKPTRWRNLKDVFQKIWKDTSPDKIHKSYKYIKNAQWSSDLRKLQIKTTMRYRYRRLRWTKFHTLTRPNAGEHVGQQEFSVVAGGNKIVQPLWRTVWQFLTKVNIFLLYKSAIAFLGICPNELKTFIYTKTSTQTFIVALFLITKP